MKNYDLLKVIASKFNGLQYPLREVHLDEVIDYCKENGIVICFGESDDLMELRGAIDDEYGCYDGGTICFDEKGNEPADANIYYPITAVWGNDDISWQYEFEPKHEIFNLYEDADIYCKGIVFFVDDLKRNAATQDCKICGLKPEFYSDGMYNLYDSCIDLASGGWTKVRAGKDEDNKVIIYGHGDSETELYRPKYCPECGRKLHD